MTLGHSLISLRKSGADHWTREFDCPFEPSPLLAVGRLYVGTRTTRCRRSAPLA